MPVNEKPHPILINLLGAEALVHVPYPIAHLIQQAGGLQRRSAGFYRNFINCYLHSTFIGNFSRKLLKGVSHGQNIEHDPTYRAFFALYITLDDVKRALVLIVTAEISLGVTAQDKPFAAWVLDPTKSSGTSIEVWPDQENPKTFAWRIVAPNGDLLATMKQPEVPRGLAVNFGQCKVAGVLRDDIFALVKHHKAKEWSLDVRSGWVADPGVKAFVPRIPKGVVCRNEGYGV